MNELRKNAAPHDWLLPIYRLPILILASKPYLTLAVTSLVHRVVSLSPHDGQEAMIRVAIVDETWRGYSGV